MQIPAVNAMCSSVSLQPLDTSVETPVTDVTDVTDVTVVAGVCLVMCQDSTTVAGGEIRLPQSTCKYM